MISPNPNSQSRWHPLSKFTRPPLAAVPSIPITCSTLGVDVLPPQGLLESFSRMAQRPRDALVDLWLSTRLHWKFRRTAVRDGRSPNKDRGSEPVYGLDAAGLAASKEAVHAHGAACRVRVCGVGEPRPWPGDVAVGVVLQLEGGGLCVGLCFEEGAPGACALWECGGEKGGERVREELVDFGCVQDWLGMGRKGLNRELVFLVEGGRDEP